jgi:membrane-bound ClpP family serine protease
MHHSPFRNFARRHTTLVGLMLLLAGVALLVFDNFSPLQSIPGGVTILASMCVTVALSLLSRMD